MSGELNPWSLIKIFHKESIWNIIVNMILRFKLVSPLNTFKAFEMMKIFRHSSDKKNEDISSHWTKDLIGVKFINQRKYN